MRWSVYVVSICMPNHVCVWDCACDHMQDCSMWECCVYSAVIEGLTPDYDLLIKVRRRLFTTSNRQYVLWSVRVDQNLTCHINIAALSESFIQWCQERLSVKMRCNPFSWALSWIHFHEGTYCKWTKDTSGAGSIYSLVSLQHDLGICSILT